MPSFYPNNIAELLWYGKILFFLLLYLTWGVVQFVKPYTWSEHPYKLKSNPTFTTFIIPTTLSGTPYKLKSNPSLPYSVYNGLIRDPIQVEVESHLYLIPYTTDFEPRTRWSRIPSLPYFLHHTLYHKTPYRLKSISSPYFIPYTTYFIRSP